MNFSEIKKFRQTTLHDCFLPYSSKGKANEDLGIEKNSEKAEQSLLPNTYNVPLIKPAANHFVYVNVHLMAGKVPLPYPPLYEDIWDSFHVRMPCSSKSYYITENVLVQRWDVICEALQQNIESIVDLERAVLSYNSRYGKQWKFYGLKKLIEENFSEEERDHFFKNTLPSMIKLALSLKNVLTRAPVLLVQHVAASITLSQMQIASLLANAFFCTFPRRNNTRVNTECYNYPDINFNRLFFHTKNNAIEKIKCILNYFRAVTTTEPCGCVTFTRNYIKSENLPSWEASSQQLLGLHINNNGLIEDAEGLLQVDFANKFVGGGVLGLGCVQEEIRYVLCPELLITRLFTEKLDATESLVITGVQKYNQYKGYGSSFEWMGSYDDKTLCDSSNHRLCKIVAIDALHFSNNPAVQYTKTNVKRELNKALIQLAACSINNRDMHYFTFGDEGLGRQLLLIYTYLTENGITVGQLVSALNQFSEMHFPDEEKFFEYITQYTSYNCDTDNEDL